MEILGIIGILLGLIAIIFFIVKGLNAIVAAPLATAIVILFNRVPLFEMMFGTDYSYVTELANFILQNFAIFLLGSLLAKYMEKSGATVSIAEKVLSVVGTDKPYPVMLALFIISSILTLGGISMFVVIFAVIPLAKPLFEKLDIAWKLVAIPVFGGMATFTMSMFPGTPAMPNILPSTGLGTPLTAAPVIGIVTSIVAITFVLIYMRIELNRSLKKNEKYEAVGRTIAEEKVDLSNLPNFVVSLIPIVTLLLMIIVFSTVQYIIVMSLTTAIVLCAILFRKNISDQRGVLNEGAQASLGTTMITGSTIAFGGVLTSVPAFSTILNAILAIPGNPLISLSIATIVISGVTGSAVGTAGIAVENFAPIYLELGIAPVIVHRIIAIASGVFGIMPHTGLGITFNEVSNLSMRENFKYQFITVNAASFLALVAAIVMAVAMG